MTQDSSDFDGKSYALIGECDNIEKLDEAMDSIKVSEKQGVLGNYCVITDALGYVVEHSDSDNSNYVLYSIGKNLMKGRVSFMKMDKKICPYCGKNLKLIAPTYNTFPQIVMGETEFIVVGELRLHSYTKCPVGKLTDLKQIKERFSKGQSVIKTFNKFGKKTKWSNPIRTVSFVKEKISNGGLSLYEENLPFYVKTATESWL